MGRRSAFKPAVWRVETPTGPIVVKDSSRTGRLTRWLARWLLGREARVLRLLEGMEGVPRFLETIDSHAFAASVVPGRGLDRNHFRERPRELAEQILDLTDRMHALGVYHLDMHSRGNYLVDDEHRVRLVDFGAAVAPGRFLRALLGPVLRHADRQAAFKFMARYAPEALSEDEARAVVRHRTLLWLWPFNAHSGRETRAARSRLR